jgi:hypothetical protein
MMSDDPCGLLSKRSDLYNISNDCSPGNHAKYRIPSGYTVLIFFMLSRCELRAYAKYSVLIELFFVVIVMMIVFPDAVIPRVLVPGRKCRMPTYG